MSLRHTILLLQLPIPPLGPAPIRGNVPLDWRGRLEREWIESLGEWATVVWQGEEPEPGPGRQARDEDLAEFEWVSQG